MEGSLRIEFDDQIFIEIRRQGGALGNRFERSLEIRFVHRDPIRKSHFLCKIQRRTDPLLFPGTGTNRHHIAPATR